MRQVAILANVEVGARRVRPNITILIAVVASAVVAAGGVVIFFATRPAPAYPTHPTPYVRYFGLHESDAPGSYAQIDQFANRIGRQPNLVTYYSPWMEQFHADFALSAAKRGALTVVLMDPQGVSLAKIAGGRYDSYLRSYASAIRAFGHPVVVSFGHEMNGNWTSWGNQHTPAAVFVSAWRHIVRVFRGVGASNVTWLWTVNVIDPNVPIPDPAPWWPGGAYVTWVGIDGYFYLGSQSFAQLFGPTIVDVRALTGDPILIAETGATNAAGQAAKINELFAGVRTYGLTGLVWFDENTEGRAWRIDSPGAFDTLGRNLEKYLRPLPATHSAEPSSVSSSP